MHRELEKQLPELRRFARAMVGNQSLGDDLVAETLTALGQDSDALTSASSLACGLYKSFCSVLHSPVGQSLLQEAEVQNFPYGSGATLADLSQQSREAFLLTTMEQFNDAEAAEILNIKSDEFSALKDQASKEVAQQLSATVFIIEDELFIASELEEIVTQLGHFVMGIARTYDEAIEKLQHISPDVILSDIQLADGSSGIDAVNQILGIQEDVAVIFITAFSKKLLTGLRPEPTFLIEKPFTPEQVGAILSQILFLKQTCQLPKAKEEIVGC